VVQGTGTPFCVDGLYSERMIIRRAASSNTPLGTANTTRGLRARPSGITVYSM
jgi:hypothetical protein